MNSNYLDTACFLDSAGPDHRSTPSQPEEKASPLSCLVVFVVFTITSWLMVGGVALAVIRSLQ